MWLDNTDIVAALLGKILPNTIFKEDSTHVLRRIMRKLQPGHPLNRKMSFLLLLASVTECSCLWMQCLVLSSDPEVPRPSCCMGCLAAGLLPMQGVLWAAGTFMRGLSDCLFDLHQPDADALKQRLLSTGQKSEEEIQRLPQSYFRKRCVHPAARCVFILLQQSLTSKHVCRACAVLPCISSNSCCKPSCMLCKG